MKTNNTIINSIMSKYMRMICAVLMVLSVSVNAWGGLVTDTYDYDDMSGKWSGSYSDQSSYWKITGTAIVTLPVSEQPTSNVTVIVKMAYFGDGTEELEKVSATGTESSSNWTLSESSMDKHPNGSTYKNCSFTITKAGSPTSLSNLAITFNKKAGKDLRIQKITISYTSSSAASISVTRSGNPVSIIDFGTITEEGTAEWTFDVSGTGLTTGYYDEYFIVSVDGDDVFYDPDYYDEYGYCYSNPDQFKVGYLVTEPGTYNGTVTVGAYKTQAAGGYYDGEWFQVDIPITITYEAEDCTIDPTIGAASLNGAISSNTSVAVQCTSVSTGSSECAWTDYGFVWGTATAPTIGGSGCTTVQVGTSGSVTSFTGSLTSTFSAGTTYYYRAYGKNSKDGAAFIYSLSTSSFIIQSITFNSNGGSAVATKYVQSGTTATAPTAPTKTGYTFGGWYQEAELTNAVNWSSAVSENKTYYAKWTAKVCTITLDKNGGDADGSASVTYDATALTSISHATRTGYHVTGYWEGASTGNKVLDDDGDFAASTVTNWITSSKWSKDATSAKLYARWEKNNYKLTVGEPSLVTITATPSGGSAIAEGADPVDVQFEKSVTLAYSGLDASARWGGWKVTKTDAPYTDVTASCVSENTLTMPAYDVTVTAVVYTDLKAWCPVINLEWSDGSDPILITSAAGQKVKGARTLHLTVSGAPTPSAKVTLGGTDLEFYDGTTKITNTNLTCTSYAMDKTITVAYAPSAYVDESWAEPDITAAVLNSDASEAASLTVSDLVNARCLPENFVIASKLGDHWYALPANCTSSTSSTAGILIQVNSESDPTSATAPTTTKYGLRQAASGTRFNSYGSNVTFTERLTTATADNQKTLYSAGASTSIQVNAQYSGYNATNPERYEWAPSTTDKKDYTLTSAASDRTLSLNTSGVFGGLTMDKAYSGKVRLLPATFVDPAEMQVVEWKASSIVVMYTGPGVSATTKVGANSESSAQTLTSKKIDHGVFELTTDQALTGNVNKTLGITIKDGSSDVVGVKLLNIPAIVSGSKGTDELGVTTAQATTTDVVVLDGATLSAVATKYTFNNITVYPGGKLVIGKTDKQLGMASLNLRGGSSWGAATYQHKYPQFVVNNTTSGAFSNSAAVINYDYVTTKDQYYTFVLPYAANTKNIKYPVDIYGDNVAANNKGSFEFQYYDGSARAGGGSGWATLAEDPTDGAALNAGQGYTFLGMPKKVDAYDGTDDSHSTIRQKYGIHRIPMSVSAANVQAGENATVSDKAVSISVTVAEANNRSGWILVGNPYLSNVTGLSNTDIQVGKLDLDDETGKWSWDETDPAKGVRYLVIPSNDGQSYESTQASTATLTAFKNFFAQIGDDEVTALSVPASTRTDKNLLPRRLLTEAETDIQLAVDLASDTRSDKVDLLINDIYSAGFDIDGDFTKMMNATNLNLYGVYPGDNLSFIAIDKTTAQNSIAIGYQVPASGQYQLQISDRPYLTLDRIEALYVTDHEVFPEITTNLLESAYQFHVNNAEVNNTRFTLSVRLAPQTPTDIENLVVPDGLNGKTLKFIWHDNMYIYQNGVIYDATGRKVKTIK